MLRVPKVQPPFPTPVWLRAHTQRSQLTRRAARLLALQRSSLILAAQSLSANYLAPWPSRTPTTTSAASPTSNIFAVQNNDASSTYFKVDNAGAVSWTGTAAGSINGNAATATTATSASSATNATNFTGALSGDVTGTQGATVLANS